MLSRRPLAIVAALILAATTIRAADVRTDAFALGVVRRDGMVIPFAAFNGRRWTTAWPAPRPRFDIPINLESVPRSWWGPTPPLAEWQLWPTSGGPPRSVRVTRPDWIEAHCLRQIGLRTDYRSAEPAPQPDEQPYPKDGLAIAPPLPLEPIERLAPESVEASELRTALGDAFDRAERELASRYRHPVKQAAREAVPVVVEAVYAFGRAPRLYYIESGRGYRTDGHDDDCSIAFGTGWFLRDRANAIRKVEMVVDLLPCTKYGASYMLPFGVLRARDRAFWIAQYSGWDHERYMVIELKKDGVAAVVSAWGGGC